MRSEEWSPNDGMSIFVGRRKSSLHHVRLGGRITIYKPGNMFSPDTRSAIIITWTSQLPNCERQMFAVETTQSMVFITVVFADSDTHHLHFLAQEYWNWQRRQWHPHSSTLARKIPWTEEPGRLQSMAQSLASTNLLSDSMDFPLLGISYKWNHTVYSLSCLASSD